MDIGPDKSPTVISENHKVGEETLIMTVEYKFFYHRLKGQNQKKSRRKILRDV